MSVLRQWSVSTSQRWGLNEADLPQRSEICGARRDLESPRRRRRRRTREIYLIRDSIYWHSVVHRSIGMALGAKCKRLGPCSSAYNEHITAFVPTYLQSLEVNHQFVARPGHIYTIHGLLERTAPCQ